MLPSWVFLADKDLDFLQAYENLYQKALTEGKALPAKIRQGVVLAILA